MVYVLERGRKQQGASYMHPKRNRIFVGVARSTVGIEFWKCVCAQKTNDWAPRRATEAHLSLPQTMLCIVIEAISAGCCRMETST